MSENRDDKPMSNEESPLISRRTMLASIGLSGMALAMGSTLGGAVGADSQTVTAASYGAGKYLDAAIITVDSIAALRQFAPKNGDKVVRTASYYAGMGKGGNEFVWAASSTEPDNGGSIIAVDGLATGRWKTTQYKLNPFQFGAYGDLFIDQSVEVFTNANIISGHDDTDAFQRMLNTVQYTAYRNNISKMKYGATVNHVFEVHDATYYVRDTLYVRSGTDIEFLGNAAIFFDPTTSKDLFSPNYQEMADAFAVKTGWNAQTIVGVRFKGGVYVGNVTKTSTVHANRCFNGANAYKWVLDNVLVERFAIGCHLYPLDTSPWTGTRRGNFYENELRNCAFHECLLGFWNQANVTQCTNLTVGGGYIVGRAGATNIADYYVRNEGGGLSVNGFNVAPSGAAVKPAKAVVYDTCAGSFWGGGYTEYFNYFFELNPVHRWGGFSFKSNLTYKETKDCYIKFTEGYFAKYDYAAKTWTETNNPTKGHNQLLMSSAFDFGRNPQLIDDFFEFLPQYDFKYGMYGVRMSGNTVNKKLVYDVKRFESTWTGFTSRNGIRLWNKGSESAELAFPIKNKQLDAYVCILYREIAPFDPRNFKLNVLEYNGTNKRITVGDDVVDYGNGWKLATVRNVNELVNKGNFIITLPVGTRIEIEHIGAYASGFPIAPVYMQYEPKVDSRNAFSLNTNYSGGKFAVGDFMYPVNTTNSSNVALNEQKINFSLCVQEGTLKPSTDMVQYSSLATAATVATEAPNLINLATGSVVLDTYYGVGDWIAVTQSGTTQQCKIVGRVFDANGQPTSQVIIDKTISNGTATVALGQAPIYRNVFQKIVRRSLPFAPPSVAANTTTTSNVTQSFASVGNVVDAFFEGDLKGTRMYAKVTAANTITVYHENPTSAAVDVSAATLTLVIYTSGNEMA